MEINLSTDSVGISPIGALFMRVFEKIKLMRQLKGWSQEEVAHRLGMSNSGYGSIERGETDVNLSRLEEIAKIFEVDLAELFSLVEQNIFNFGGSNHCQNWHTHSPPNQSFLGSDLEKMQSTNEQQAKEIEYLKQQNADLREVNANLKDMINLLKKTN